MKLEMVKPEAIRPDPNQPRRSIPQRHVEELAQSFVQDGIGIINPIEVDDDDIIVTGELRWRASQLAGLKLIPIKRFQPQTAELRFFRQVHENLHQGSYADRQQMTALDTANSLATLLDMEGEGKLGEMTPVFPEHRGRGGDTPQSGKTADKHYHALAARLGCSVGYVREHIELIRGKGDPELREAVQQGKVPRTMLRSVSMVTDKKLRRKLGKQVVKEAGKFYRGGQGTGGVGRDKVDQIALAINRSPQYGDELVLLARAGIPLSELHQKINSIAPTRADAAVASVAPGEELSKTMHAIRDQVADAGSLAAFPRAIQPLLEEAARKLHAALGSFIAESPELDVIEGKVLAQTVK